MTTTSGPSAAIEALGLGKAFGAVKAVDGLDLSVPSGNVFVSPATLPGWLRAFVAVNPVSHLVTAERALMAGTWAPGQVGWVLLASAALTAVFGPLTMRLYHAGQGGS